ARITGEGDNYDHRIRPDRPGWHQPDQPRRDGPDDAQPRLRAGSNPHTVDGDLLRAARHGWSDHHREHPAVGGRSGLSEQSRTALVELRRRFGGTCILNPATPGAVTSVDA